VIGWLRSLFGGAGPSVSPREAVQRMNRGAALLDVREAREFAAGHAPGAIHLPLGRIRAEGAACIDSLALPADAREILLVCQGGMRSRAAQSILSADPGRCYVNVSGGMADWMATGLPVVQNH
jgi:rhodanese-related sulfurtransferase